MKMLLEALGSVHSASRLMEEQSSRCSGLPVLKAGFSTSRGSGHPPAGPWGELWPACAIPAPGAPTCRERKALLSFCFGLFCFSPIP